MVRTCGDTNFSVNLGQLRFSLRLSKCLAGVGASMSAVDGIRRSSTTSASTIQPPLSVGSTPVICIGGPRRLHAIVARMWPLSSRLVIALRTEAIGLVPPACL